MQHRAQLVLRQCGVQDTLQPFRALTGKQAAQLLQVCKRLKQSQTSAVSPQVMRSVLTAAEYSSYTISLLTPTSLLDVLRVDGKPDVIVHYASMIDSADIVNSRADDANKNPNNDDKSSKLRLYAEVQYESACEYLAEQLIFANTQTDKAIRAWLDRDFDMSTAGKITKDCVGVARVVDSGSKYCLPVAESRQPNKQQHKLLCQQQALTGAACSLLYEPELVAANLSESTDITNKQSLSHMESDDEDLY